MDWYWILTIVFIAWILGGVAVTAFVHVGTNKPYPRKVRSTYRV